MNIVIGLPMIKLHYISLNVSIMDLFPNICSCCFTDDGMLLGISNSVCR